MVREHSIINIGVNWLPWQYDVRTFFEMTEEDAETPVYEIPV